MSDFIIRDASGNKFFLEIIGEGTKENPFVPTFDQSSKRTPMYQLMDQVGDGSGNDNMNVDGSVTPVSFKVVPPVGVTYGIARVIVGIRDTGSIDAGGWGSNAGVPLTNGNKLIWHRGGVDIELTKTPIKSHYDLARVCHDIELRTWGTGDEFVTARFTFTKSGQYIILDGNLGDYLEVVIQDDLTYLVSQSISAQGYQVNS